MNVLLVEDNPVLGDAVCDHVSGERTRCRMVSDACGCNSCRRQRGSRAGHIDLRLPDGNGLSLLRRLRSRSNDVPIIILTAHDQVSDQIEGFSCGATDYLVKPFGLSDLDNRMHAVYSKHRGNCLKT